MTTENQANYDELYTRSEAFLRWPADWILRFHNMFLRERLPSDAQILDFGCGSGNNSIPFLKMGHAVMGIEVAQSSRDLVRQNLEFHGLPLDYLHDLQIVSPPIINLPYKDNTFDFVLSNQVHYYSASEDELHSVNSEIERVLKPGGIFFVTMMGPKNYYISDFTRSVTQDGIHNVRIDDDKHRLAGVHEDVLVCRDEDHLRNLFHEFGAVTVGYFDQKMFDMKSNFHWIFVGKKL